MLKITKGTVERRDDYPEDEQDNQFVRDEGSSGGLSRKRDPSKHRIKTEGKRRLVPGRTR